VGLDSALWPTPAIALFLSNKFSLISLLTIVANRLISHRMSSLLSMRA
jgi:hypothetical protein